MPKGRPALEPGELFVLDFDDGRLYGPFQSRAAAVVHAETLCVEPGVIYEWSVRPLTGVAEP